MSSKLLIKNCHFYDNPAEDNLTDLLIVDGQIARIGQNISDFGVPAVDAGGRVLTPGFIDIHIQGAGGADVMDSAEALTVISRTLARFGITGFLATTIVKPEIDNRHLAVIAQNVGKDLGGARILGIHLEGPFINPHKRGGIASSALCPPSFQMLNQILEMTNETLRMMTIAPELPGNHEIIQQLTKIGIVASFGHSAANYRETKDGLAAGISHVTHIFNAMPALHHREPGPVAAIFESETITAQIISDGIHLHPAIINLLWKNLGKNRCICISDGIQAIGLPDGRYLYNGREYEACNGSACYDDGTLIGTAIGVNEISRRFRQFTGCSTIDAINTITINPAKVINDADHIGRISVRADADLVILDPDESVFMTIVKGRIVYHKNSSE